MARCDVTCRVEPVKMFRNKESRFKNWEKKVSKTLLCQAACTQKPPHKQYATHSTQIKTQMLFFCSKSFTHDNSDFIHQALCVVQLRIGCHVGQKCLSSPVYYAFLCRSCVFFNKENRKKNTIFGLVCNHFSDRHQHWEAQHLYM